MDELFACALKPVVGSGLVRNVSSVPFANPAVLFAHAWKK